MAYEENKHHNMWVQCAYKLGQDKGRAEALDEAAQIAERYSESPLNCAIAREIRALKERKL